MGKPGEGKQGSLGAPWLSPRVPLHFLGPSMTLTQMSNCPMFILMLAFCWHEYWCFVVSHNLSLASFPSIGAGLAEGSAK